MQVCDVIKVTSHFLGSRKGRGREMLRRTEASGGTGEGPCGEFLSPEQVTEGLRLERHGKPNPSIPIKAAVPYHCPGLFQYTYTLPVT
jgi:hypothetical protein